MNCHDHQFYPHLSMVVLDIPVPITPINPAAGGDGAFIGARGISLSGGQKARVALARAAYNPKAVPWSTARSTATPWVCHGLPWSAIFLQSLEDFLGVECCSGGMTFWWDVGVIKLRHAHEIWKKTSCVKAPQCLKRHCSLWWWPPTFHLFSFKKWLLVASQELLLLDVPLLQHSGLALTGCNARRRRSNAQFQFQFGMTGNALDFGDKPGNSHEYQSHSWDTEDSKDPFGSVDAPTAAWILEVWDGCPCVSQQKVALHVVSCCPTGASVWPNGAEPCSNCGVAARECLLEQQAIHGVRWDNISLSNQIRDQSLQVHTASCPPEGQPNGLHGITGKHVDRMSTERKQSRQGRINGMGAESKQNWTDQPMAEGTILKVRYVNWLKLMAWQLINT